MARNISVAPRFKCILATACALLIACCTAASAWAADGYESMGFRCEFNTLGPYARFGAHRAQDGAIAYCYDYGAAAPTEPGASGYTQFNKGWSWQTGTVNIIAYNGYPNTTTIGGTKFNAEDARCATQIAIWIALGDMSEDGVGKDGAVFHGPDGRDKIVRAAAKLAQQAADGKLKAPRYTKRYNAVVRDGETTQKMLWTPIEVDVSFTKTSADADITDGNAQYAYSGASYDIFLAADDTKVTSITTDKNGHATCSLQPGTNYYARETKAPAGFKLNKDRIAFTANEGKEVTLKDQPGTFALTMSKRDSSTLGSAQAGAALSGAEFQLTSLSSKGFTLKGTTDGSGTLRFSGIPLGEVKVVETKAPEGYRLDPAAKTYTVTAGGFAKNGTVELIPEQDFLEDVVAFDLEISKFVDDGSEEGSGIERPMKGVAFEVVSNSTGKAIGRIVTGEDGHASTAGQWFGAGSRGKNVRGAIPYDSKGYTVREVAETVPDGFARVDDWTIDADQIIDGATLRYIVDNHALTGRLQLVKVDAGTGNTAPLAGFTFQIIDSHGKAVSQETWYPKHQTLDRFTTDDTGMVTLPEPLKAGRYTVREITAQAPYLLADKDLAFTITGSDDGKAPLTVVKIPDEHAMGKASITKRCSEDGETLAGAAFDVIAREDIISPDGTVRATAGQVVDQVTTDKNGTATTAELHVGSGTARYAFVETKPPTEHVLDSTPVPFELSYANQETAVVTTACTMDNKPTEVSIVKTDMETGELLPGATFALWNAADELENNEGGDESRQENEVQTSMPVLKPGKETQTYTTDGNGAISIRHLKAGTYRIMETEAPAGYVVDPTIRTFTIGEDGFIDGRKSLRIDIKDDFTKIDISKRDITTEEELPGAELEIRDADGAVIESWTSGDEPHRINRLAPGTYTLIERMTPNTYDQATSVEFTVEATGEIQTVTMHDEPIRITGELDKRQEIADPVAPDTEANGDGKNRAATKISEDGRYDYALDFRSTSSTWADEFTVEDRLLGTEQGLARLTGITTPRAEGDYDGKMNVWYRTSSTPGDFIDPDGANATLDDGHENPWLSDERTAERLGDDGRALDYTGWKLWKADIPTDSSLELSTDDLGLASGEHIVAVRLEYGRVEAGFTTRRGNWERDDLKHEHDDMDDIASSDEESRAAAILHMQVTDAYTPGTTLDNEAILDVLRNGGGEGLEGHDEDRVTQTTKSTIVQLAKTGVASVGGIMAALGIGILALRRRNAKPKRIEGNRR